MTTTTMAPEDLAKALGLGVSAVDPNRDALQRCLDAADIEAEAAVDSVDPAAALTYGQPLYDSVVLQRSVEWWKANDAAFGGVGSAETGGLRPRAPEAPFDRHAAALAPLKQQWGCA